MENNDIINFKKDLENLSIDELTIKRDELQQQISKMILESDTIVKVAIIENLLTEKLNKETKQDGSSK